MTFCFYFDFMKLDLPQEDVISYLFFRAIDLKISKQIGIINSA